MQISVELQTAIDAAKKGGKVAFKYFQTDLEISIKKDDSFVTKADVAVENVIKQRILQQFPHAKFIAEESGGDRNQSDIWIIDPIDGTRVFTRGIPIWAILIAHYKNGEITSGICYLPSQDILCFAEKGKGAYLNNKKIHVSQTTSVQRSFGSFGSIRHFTSVEPILKLKKHEVVLRSYEHAYAVCMLAEGKMDVFLDGYGKVWDYAPFICIVKEAGGKVTDFQGEKWNLSSKNLLASNGILHEQLLQIISNK